MGDKDATPVGVAAVAVLVGGALKHLHDVGVNVFHQLEHAGAETAADTVSFVSATGLNVAGMGLGLGLLFASAKTYQLFNANEMKAIRISPSKEHDVKPEQVEKLVTGFYYARRKWYKQLIKGRVWFRYLILRDEEGKIHFYILVPEDLTRTVQSEIKDYFPQHLVNIDNDFKQIPFFEKDLGMAGHMKLKGRKGFGLGDDLHNNLGSIINSMPKGSVLDIRFSPTKRKKLIKEAKPTIKKLTEIGTDEAKALIKQVRNRYAKGQKAFDVSISIWAKYSHIHDIAKQLKQHTAGVHREIALKKYNILSEKRNALAHDVVAPLPNRTMLWNHEELASLLFTPPVSHPIMDFVATVVEKLKPKAHELVKGLKIAVVDHDEMLKHDEQGNIDFDKSRAVCLQWDTLDRHGIVVGRTGSGKGGLDGSMMDSFLLDWVKNPSQAAGITKLDPHLQGLLLVINRLQALEDAGHTVNWDKVRCYSFDPSNEYPTPMNLLHGDDDKIDNKVKETTEIILQAFESQNLSQSKVVLEAALHALLWDDEPHTIAEIPRLFRDDDFLHKVMNRIGNPVIKEYFVEEVIKAKEQSKNGKPQNLTALITRIFPFISQQTMQRSYCQEKNVIDGKRIFENGEIVLLDFKGAPEESYKLTAAWLANHYYKTAIKREPYSGRHHILDVDEAQLFRIGRFADIIRETRKFRFGLKLMTQDINQMDSRVTEALKTNSGYIVSLAQNEGIEQMVKLMNNKFKVEDIKALPDNHGALYSVDGSCNIVFPAPALIWKGERTSKGSYEAKLAYKRAKEKFDELVKRDCKHYSEVDAEIKAKMEGKQRLAVVQGGWSSVE